jgi:REP element-mobilizing transposase RayT
MCRIAKENGLTILAINSVEDHIHVLGKMHASCVLTDTIGKMKSNTTKWLNSKSLDIGPVYWQNGYYARSVDPSGVAVVKDYIERQQEHHQQRG